MEEKQYYCVTTRKFILRCGHEEWLQMTQDLYNKVLLFYYQLYLKLEEPNPGTLQGHSNQQILRELEKSTIVGRNKEPVAYPLPYEKVPLYFRRAAINGAIASAKSYLAISKTGKLTKKTEAFQKGVTYYKGMYQKFTQNHISLKVWNGNKWVWLNCRLSGNYFPDGATVLSPTVNVGNQNNSLLVPVRESVTDGRKAVIRVQEQTNICSVQFSNEDTFAVAVILNSQGGQIAVHFFKGGLQYQHLCKKLLEKIRKSQEAMGKSSILDDPVKTSLTRSYENEESSELEMGKKEHHLEKESILEVEPEHYGKNEKNNKKYWMKLKHIKNYYAHTISRQIVNFSMEYQAGIIILPKYDEKFTKYVMLKAGNWSSLHLSQKIRELITYKAWKSGILVLEVHPGRTSSYCAYCQAAIKKKENTYICPNGHRGSRQINTARNLGKKFLNSFARENMQC